MDASSLRAMLVMKRQFSWQEHGRNIRSEDLNQLAASQLDLPQKPSGTGRREITKRNIGNPQLGSKIRQRELYHGPLLIVVTLTAFITT
jgi:hypothetical protein